MYMLGATLSGCGKRRAQRVRPAGWGQEEACVAVGNDRALVQDEICWRGRLGCCKTFENTGKTYGGGGMLRAWWQATPRAGGGDACACALAREALETPGIRRIKR